MIQFSLVNPEKDETKTQICYHNLLVADQYYNLDYFISASRAWLNLNPSKNYQDLEKLLRDNNFNTHLYAKPVDISKTKLSLQRENNGTEYLYECIFSCRPKELALKEVLDIWKTYEENFERLALAASIIVSDINMLDINNPDLKIFDNDKLRDIKDITDCTKKIVAEKIDAEEFINKIFVQHTNKFGIAPTIKIVALLGDMARIYGIFGPDNKLVSNIGYMIKLNNSSHADEKILIDLSKLRN